MNVPDKYTLIEVCEYLNIELEKVEDTEIEVLEDILTVYVDSTK